jgi:hypothetical protein
MAKRNITKGQTTIYKIEQANHYTVNAVEESNQNVGCNLLLPL